jgi:hypothetical protein
VDANLWRGTIGGGTVVDDARLEGRGKGAGGSCSSSSVEPEVSFRDEADTEASGPREMPSS